MKNDFDFCLIDCPPSLTALTINAMVASDHLLIPVNALYFSYTAIESINTMYHSVKSSGLNPNLNLLGMFVTQLNSRRTVEKSILNSYKNDYPEIFFDSSIRTNVAIPESQTPPNCTDIFEYAPKSNGAKDYNKLTNELLKRLK